MKIVINTDFGGISEGSASRRFDPEFIAAVESGRFVGAVMDRWGYAETLKVVEIPDDATDYRIFNYDGKEGIIYCLGGKLYIIGDDQNETFA